MAGIRSDGLEQHPVGVLDVLGEAETHAAVEGRLHVRVVRGHAPEARALGDVQPERQSVRAVRIAVRDDAAGLVGRDVVGRRDPVRRVRGPVRLQADEARSRPARG